MTEIELKFLLTGGQVSSVLARLRTLRGLTGPVQTLDLRSVYHDTEDDALRQSGFALRVRHDGAGWVQTCKGRLSNHAGLQTTQESEAPLAGGEIDLAAIPDEAMRDRVISLVGDTPLVPRVETAITRHAATVAMGGWTRAEVALDTGTLRGGDRTADLHELELELKSGHVTALFDLARELMPEGGLRLSRMSKAARAFALADGGDAIPNPAPRKARTVALTADQTAETAARDVLRECLDQIAANADAVRNSDAVEGPHQLRIGLRRMRAALDIFGPVLAGPALDHLKAEARWLGRETGHLRDLDVAVHDLLRPEAESHPTEPGFARLADLLADAATAQRSGMRTTLAGTRAQGFLLDLAQFIEARGWLDPGDIDQSARLAQPLSGLAKDALARHWSRATKRARGIDTLSIEARHDLRKTLKSLRYAVEFLGPVLDEKPTRAFVKRLRTLQDVFGDLNDLAMAQTLLSGPQAPGADDPQVQRAVGWILGARTVRAEAAWSHARALWHDLRDAPRPWDMG
ncbi:CYTH and CHAD domain-containing protein [Meridianimarinicoccus sp. RP-17]|uniref:CYTH and CHAD domain-containing protein n=1 Tax=Meridianimarinicoccus zhengii TaxID=2056810 RepID=UPI000DADACAB|nr:CHAD domain-containing protein [Phycocomes zhengii]